MECKKRREEGLKLRKESKTHLWAQGGLHISLVVDLLVLLCVVVLRENGGMSIPS